MGREAVTEDLTTILPMVSSATGFVTPYHSCATLALDVLPEARSGLPTSRESPMSRREAYRHETLAAIHRIAQEQLEASGAGAISLKAIARELGMTGPALFRYVPSRDDLLTALTREAYGDLADALDGAVRQTVGLPPADRLRAHGGALRTWALANRHRYQLIFGSPVPGYATPDGATTLPAIRVLASVFDLAEPGDLVEDDQPRSGAETLLAAELGDWAESGNVPVRSYRWLRQGFIWWTRLHGVLSLELEGHFGPSMPDPEVIYFAELEALVKEIAPNG